MDENDIKLLSDYKERIIENDNTVVYEMFELIITKLSVVQMDLK